MHHVGIVAELTHDLHHIDALPQCPRLRRSWIAAPPVMFLYGYGKPTHQSKGQPAWPLHAMTCS